MNDNKPITIKENGIQKLRTDNYCKKVKLSQLLDAKEVEKIMEKVRNDR